MKTSRTVRGTPFKYTGSLDGGLTVFFKTSSLRISPEIIRVICQEISARSPVRMGANRKPLVPDSVGETIREKYKASPQIMSYVVPLLVEDGFCTVNDQKPYILRKK